MQRSTFAQEAKKFFLMAASFALAIVLLGGVKAAAASTATVKTDDGTFTINYGYDVDGYVLSGYQGSETNITLPATVSISGTETAITTLGDAFKGNKFITSVTIPEGYTTIDLSALNGCEKLTSLSIPSTVNSIYASAFEGCTSLTTVTFAENPEGSLAFKGKAFYGCTSLESINLPVQTSNVNDDGNIFVGCTALKSVTVTDGCANYFSDNGSLYAKNDAGTGAILCTYGNVPAELTIPATAGGLPVTALGIMTFYENKAITSVTVPASVTVFERMCLSYCSNLKTLVLQCETAPELGSSPFTSMATDSVIYVANQDVADAIINSSYKYTPANTTVTVGTPSAPAVDASATLSLALGTVQQDKVSFDLYLDSASGISVAALKMTLDADKVASVSVSDVNTAFDITTNDYSAEKGLTLYFGKTGGENFSCTERTKLATVTVTLTDDAKGSLTATLTDAKVSNTDKQADATISTASVTARILSYDVNGDGKIDLKDIAEAQRYYQAKTGDENWTKAQAADVNGDGVVDIQDYIALFHAVVDAMGW